MTKAKKQYTGTEHLQYKQLEDIKKLQTKKEIIIKYKRKNKLLYWRIIPNHLTERSN